MNNLRELHGEQYLTTAPHVTIEDDNKKTIPEVFFLVTLYLYKMEA